MSTPLHAVVSGSFTSDGTAVSLSLPSGYNKFEMYNVTDLGSASTTSVMTAEGLSAMSAGGAYYSIGAGGSSTLTEKYTSTGGFTFVSDSGSTAAGSPIALNSTEINQADPAVADSGTTSGLTAGVSVVRLKNTTGMLQVSGYDFTVGTIVGATSFQLKFLDSTQTGFGADATAGSYTIINADPRFYPKRRFITKIASSTTTTVVTMSVTHGFTAGQSVRLIVPDAWGMSSLNGQLGNITAVNTSTNTITLDIDSSSYGAFSWPNSATAAAGVSPALVVPVGETANATYANNLADATDNQSYTGVTIGTTVQTTGKVYQWVASKGVSV